jgi:uncharacterized membrane protein YfcA
MEKDIVLLLAGFIVGAMNAIAGGGMLIGFPVMVALGIPPLVANATGAVVSGPGQLSSALGYRKYLRKVPSVYLWLILPIVVGATVGALTLRNTPAADFGYSYGATQFLWRLLRGWLRVHHARVLRIYQPARHSHDKRHEKCFRNIRVGHFDSVFVRCSSD